MFDNFSEREKLSANYRSPACVASARTQMLARFSTDGCHPNPDTYFIMEELVVKAIDEALK